MATACSYFKFELIQGDRTGPRLGRILFRHGVVETPAFFPVGTVGTVKGVSCSELEAVGVRGMLSNAFHIYLRGNLDLIRRLGGLHNFVRFKGMIITDSGGFHIKSLAQHTRVTPEGMQFSSPFDGSRHFLSPEEVVHIQEALDSDVKLPLDVCPSYPEGEKEQEHATRLTLQWYERAQQAVKKPDQGFLGIVQGGFDEALRRWAARETVKFGFHGYAIGGLSVGEPKHLTFQLLQAVNEELPSEQIRYLMGMGKPQDIVTAVEIGTDLFDCVIPTRNARNGTLYTWKEGVIRIRNSSMKDDPCVIEEGCRCPACAGGYSRAFLAYLYRCGEMLALKLLTLHNLFFFQTLMNRIREAVKKGTFGELKTQVLDLFGED